MSNKLLNNKKNSTFFISEDKFKSIVKASFHKFLPLKPKTDVIDSFISVIKIKLVKP